MCNTHSCNNCSCSSSLTRLAGRCNSAPNKKCKLGTGERRRRRGRKSLQVSWHFKRKTAKPLAKERESERGELHFSRKIDCSNAPDLCQLNLHFFLLAKRKKGNIQPPFLFLSLSPIFARVYDVQTLTYLRTFACPPESTQPLLYIYIYIYIYKKENACNIMSLAVQRYLVSDSVQFYFSVLLYSFYRCRCHAR